MSDEVLSREVVRGSDVRETVARSRVVRRVVRGGGGARGQTENVEEEKDKQLIY